MQPPAPALTAGEETALDQVVSMLLATQRFAFSLGDAPAEEADDDTAAATELLLPPAPPEECTRREVRGSASLGLRRLRG